MTEELVHVRECKKAIWYKMCLRFDEFDFIWNSRKMFLYIR
jgi:hypothetical protein